MRLNRLLHILWCLAAFFPASSWGKGEGPPLSSIVGLAAQADGNYVVTDANLNALVRIDRATGDRAVISGCIVGAHQCPQGVIGAGPLPRQLDDVALEPSGTLVVGDYQRRSIFRVDPATGDRVILSGCQSADVLGNCEGEPVGAGQPFDTLSGLAVEPSGGILVTDIGYEALMRVDPVTGDRTWISGCLGRMRLGECEGELVGQGPMLGWVGNIAWESPTSAVVTDTDDGKVTRVDLTTGDRSVVSGCTHGGVDYCEGTIVGEGPILGMPRGIAVEPGGSLVVASYWSSRVLIRVDPVTGDRSVVSGCTPFEGGVCSGPVVGEGPLFEKPGKVVSSQGELVVADGQTSAILGVDPVSGDRAIVSDLLDLAVPPSSTPGSRVQCSVPYVSPGEWIHFVASTTGVALGGGGPCPAALGGLCLDLLPPIWRLGAAEADPSGTAKVAPSVPAGAEPGQTIYLQAVVQRGEGASESEKSGVDALKIVAP